MSAGRFTGSRYQASYGAGTAVHPIRVQPETIALTIDSVANDPPSGAISNPISAVVSRGRNTRGLRPRLVTLRAPDTNPPATYLAGGITTVPLLTPAIATAAANADDETTVSYLGLSTWTVVGVSAEVAQ
jgi:hypothetical protein